MRDMVNTHPQSVGGEKHGGQGPHVVLGQESTTQILVRGVAMQVGTQDQRINAVTGVGQVTLRGSRPSMENIYRIREKYISLPLHIPMSGSE